MILSDVCLKSESFVFSCILPAKYLICEDLTCTSATVFKMFRVIRWNGLAIKELDISRQTIIVMVKRNGTMLVPNGNLILMEGDHVILYSQERINHASLIQI